MNTKNKILFLIALLFIGTRLFNLGQIYHQDEAKWIYSSAIGEFNPIHPPLASFLFIQAGRLVDFGWERLIPIVFGLLIITISTTWVWQRFGRRAGFWTAFILFISVYNLHASIQIDIDGALLPFFVVLLFFVFE